MIDPGRMDRLVRLQKPHQERTDGGQVVLSYQDADHPAEWAFIHSDGTSSRQGDEAVLSDHDSAYRNRVMVIWYRPDIQEDWTVLYEGKRWDIKSIEEIGRREGLSIRIQWRQGQYED